MKLAFLFHRPTSATEWLAVLEGMVEPKNRVAKWLYKIIRNKVEETIADLDVVEEGDVYYEITKVR